MSESELSKSPTPDPAEDNAFFPSAYSLSQYTSDRTDFGGVKHAGAYTGGRWKILMIATDERYLLMDNGTMFSTGNHPVEMLLPLHHLMAAGFDGYAVDLRRGTTAYYLQSGEAVELASAHGTGAVAERWDEAAVRAAIRDAQAQVPGYTYLRFCARLSAAGCAGYVVSFLGRRVLYFGRTAETHTEHFPRAA